MTAYGILSQLLDLLAALMLAPLLTGWVNQCRAWLQNRRAPDLVQPYRLLHKLFQKESVVAEHASSLFRLTPYLIFGCMTLACSIIPMLSTELPLAQAADAIALVGLFAIARAFISLAAMDIGTAFGSLGARREMLIGFLAEPALLTVFFTSSLIHVIGEYGGGDDATSIRHLSQPGVRGNCLHHGSARRKCPHTGR